MEIDNKEVVRSAYFYNDIQGIYLYGVELSGSDQLIFSLNKFFMKLMGYVFNIYSIPNAAIFQPHLKNTVTSSSVPT